MDSFKQEARKDFVIKLLSLPISKLEKFSLRLFSLGKGETKKAFF